VAGRDEGRDAAPPVGVEAEDEGAEDLPAGGDRHHRRHPRTLGARQGAHGGDQEQPGGDADGQHAAAAGVGLHRERGGDVGGDGEREAHGAVALHRPRRITAIVPPP
jgi:hypothetical protein